MLIYIYVMFAVGNCNDTHIYSYIHTHILFLLFQLCEPEKELTCFFLLYFIFVCEL